MAIKQRLYLNPAQEAALVEHCHQTRFVYNSGLAQRMEHSRTKQDDGEVAGADEGAEAEAQPKPKVNFASQCRWLAELRKELDWLGAGSSSIQQGALRDLDRAFKNFFEGHARYPSFKKRADRQGSFYVRDLKTRRVGNRYAEVFVPKAGWVTFRPTRPWAEIEWATSARVTHKNGRWHVCFTTEVPPKRTHKPTSKVVGIDRGCANTLATDTSQMFQAPVLTQIEQDRYVRLQWRLARQQKGSKNRAKTLDKMAVLRRRLDDRRTNWVEQTTTHLADTYDMIAVEALCTASMVRRAKPKPDPEKPGAYLPNGARAKSALNKAIYSSLWGRTLTRLEAKMPGDAVVKVNPYNTSRTCAACGHVSADSRESQAVFVCVSCGHAAHADTNAAVNILALGTRQEPTDSGASPVALSTTRQEPEAGASPPTQYAAQARTGIPVLQVGEDVKEMAMACSCGYHRDNQVAVSPRCTR